MNAPGRGRWGGRCHSSTAFPPTPADPDALFEAFEAWVGEQGLTLYPAQEEALIEVVTGANVILSHADRHREEPGRRPGRTSRRWPRAERTFYTAPIKALVSEKFFALIAVFGAENVGMLTGDAAVNAAGADHLLHRRGAGQHRAARGGRAPTSARW